MSQIRFSVRSEPPFVVFGYVPHVYSPNARGRVAEESVRADLIRGVKVMRTDGAQDAEETWGVVVDSVQLLGAASAVGSREDAERFAADVRRCVVESGLWRRG